MTDKRTLLLAIAPPFWPKMPPVGPGYIQSYLDERGIKADILDINNVFYNLADRDLKKEWLRSCNVFLEENIFALIRDNYSRQFTHTVEEMLKYDIVGFSCFKSNIKSTIEIIKTLRAGKKSVKIILGGPEITRRYFKNRGRIDERIAALSDFLVAGEGERPLGEYLRDRKKEEKIAAFEQLDSIEKLPFPRYKGLDFSSYPRRGALPIQMSRGCFRKCAFCSERLLHRGFRARSIESVLREISYYRDGESMDHFVFFDSLINADLIKLEALCDGLIEAFGAVNWEAQMAVRDDMGQGLFEKMKKSGCRNLFVGLESGSDRTLERMNKGFDTKAAVKFFKGLKASGLAFGISVITGFPGETEEDFKESLDFVLRHKDIIPKIEQINPFTYYEGTDADKEGDYKTNEHALRRMDVFVKAIKENGFKYTNAFLGNLVEKGAVNKDAAI